MGEIMKGKILTGNVILFTECSEEKCDNTGTMDIEELRDFGEGDCEKCGAFMMISQECMIKD